MHAMIMLCDSAQVANGKLFILGGGWNHMGWPPGQSAIALKVDVPEAQVGVPVQLDVVLELVDGDGHPVMNGNPVDPQPIQLSGSTSVVRQPGLAPRGSQLEAPFAVNFGPLPVEPGGRYTWNLKVNDETHDDWHVDFSVGLAT